ncbi:hypothetical protein D9M71_206070 [compost metagenome]
MLPRLFEDVLQDAALGQADVGQLPIPAGQRAMQGRMAFRRGRGQALEEGFDTLVDVAFPLVEHRVGEQPHIVGRVAQRQLEDRDGALAGHPPGSEDRRQPLVRVGRMAQHILQAAVAEHQLRPLLAGTIRQLRHADGLPGLLSLPARPVQRREYRGGHPDESQQRHEERQAEDEQRAPRQRPAIARRQQQPYPAGQQQAADAMGGGIRQGHLDNRQITGDTEPTAQFAQQCRAK